ncbi:hypothetical protein M441DRAFT_30866 [Trichoderma asperellum CBS 433.97]|uniref:Uncharacterized protein n=2 Tax=Trichoderma asperellum TaxID=101201 RepID=A0A2T3YWP9_TRIA4|nr:hypothetical protein M441DRAFT_30866 [Trichoderma asperellum CBS 433.97]PTB36983.1 hypothetical protein M441DRAFT_30866 [Trichoderma asperellum CBS 433.97]
MAEKHLERSPSSSFEPQLFSSNPNFQVRTLENSIALLSTQMSEIRAQVGKLGARVGALRDIGLDICELGAHVQAYLDMQSEATEMTRVQLGDLKDLVSTLGDGIMGQKGTIEKRNDIIAMQQEAITKQQDAIMKQQDAIMILNIRLETVEAENQRLNEKVAAL